MDNIYRGEPISKEEFIKQLVSLGPQIEKDLLLAPLLPEVVIEAAHALSESINYQEIKGLLGSQGVQEWTAENFLSITVNGLNKEYLRQKVRTELGENPFEWLAIAEEVQEKKQALGVIMHIGAGNALGLSALSVIEGLLSGNINILKLPEYEGGISSKLLLKLIEIEPRLKPYIYVLDVSSKDTDIIGQLVAVANGVVVWGSDTAISGIRQIVPPSLPIIEWGHKISFSYFTENQNVDEALHGLAKDICLTEQLYCSSPQCVFYETDDFEALDAFANKLASKLEDISNKYPPATRPINAQAEITWQQELIKMEEVLGEKRLITDHKYHYGVMVDYTAKLKASPLYRNIWVMPIKRKDLLGILRAYKGYLQTVGLSCNTYDEESLTKILYAAGVNRIYPCGQMSNTYSGEPHDGVYTLARYTRTVNKRSN